MRLRQAAPAAAMGATAPAGERVRARAVLLALVGCLLVISAQVVRVSLAPRSEPRLSAAEPITRMHARPDIVDRSGRIIATDVAAPSLYADPALILDLDEMIETLAKTMPQLDEAELRRTLGDRTRRFAWVKRRMTPVEAQRAHELGLPGLSFRREPKRVYPTGALTGHIAGHVNIDNRGMAGLERFIDERMGLDVVAAAAPSRLRQVKTTLDIGVQHAVTEELAAALGRYGAAAAAGLVMDVETGGIIAAVSLPSVDPNKPGDGMEATRDRLQGGVYELGSILKTLTVAMALEDGTATLERTLDTTAGIEIGRHTIKDLHPAPAPLSVRDIFLQSSNVGAGLIALEAGAGRQLAFLARIGLTEPMRTEAGPVAAPLLPARWDRIETVTIAYGHGIAVAPIQFAAAAAALVNGGRRVVPHLIADGERKPGDRILTERTSEAMREILRLNVTRANGTGRRADVPGYRVGGKTGTAEIPGETGYRRKAVIASFLGAFPMEQPRYLTLVSLFEPQATAETRGQITAGVNAAPTTARLVERIAPILGVLPRRLDTAGREER